tara:strand:+ start:359 stop:529 length:171 start_codon:yes stop_codon:yes gene_type:complete
MKAGDLVKSTKDSSMGIISAKREAYSSWGELHVYIKWLDGHSGYYPVKFLEVIENG